MPGTVLVVEDNRLHRMIYVAALKAHGFCPIELADSADPDNCCLSLRDLGHGGNLSGGRCGSL
jgi:hypothetical protein